MHLFYGKKKICENITITDEITYLSEEITNSETSYKTNFDIDIPTYKLSFDGFLNGDYENNNLSDEDIKRLYNDVKDYLINDYDGSDIILYSKNVKVQISSIDSDINSIELSDIDLGECGRILKEKYCNSKDESLTILKFDIHNTNVTDIHINWNMNLIHVPRNTLTL